MRFNRFFVVGVVAVVLVGLAALFPVRRTQMSASVPDWAVPHWELMDQYCTTCHDQAEQKGGLALDTLDFNRLAQNAETWEKVVRKVRTGMMPPADEPRPRRAALDAFAAGIESRLDTLAAQAPDPGVKSLHRLNRTEYANAIRDLLALEVNVASMLPGDDSSEGFDNIADVLGVSPSLIEGYVSAAMKISRWAVGDRTMIASRQEYRAPAGLAQDAHIEGLPLGTRGGMMITHTFPLDAEYEFSLAAGAGGPGLGGGRAPGRGPEVVFVLDGEPVEVKNPRSFKLNVKAGARTIGVAVADRSRATGVDDVFSVFGAGGGVQNLVITGPFKPTGPGDTESRRQIFVCYPKSAEEELPCARNIVASIAGRAFRRPLADTDPGLKTLMSFYEKGRAEGDFESGVQQALARVLVDPRFLFRVEEEPAQLAEGSTYPVNDYDLASRLSFFLWSSIPDKEMLDAAGRGELRDPKILDQKIRRMSADSRPTPDLENTAGQWLQLRALDASEPESRDFGANLGMSFGRETAMLFAVGVREDRSVIDLIDADYTFVDERLAKHYGIPNVRGSYVRRVQLDKNSPRRGILGHGSVLTVTSVANRTSPVVRGAWVLENVLGSPPPKPPAGVETNLDVDPNNVKTATLRERLELHRTDPVCASCHKIMDPIGLALENFDLVGKWREAEGDHPIDASGVMVDGNKLNGPVSLRKAILARKEAFVTTLTEKLMTYALGRGVHYYDMPTVRQIVRNAEEDDYKFSSIVLGIAHSTPFQMRKKAGSVHPETDAARQVTQVAGR
jgi:mono/diheme cytochrome c family protein